MTTNPPNKLFMALSGIYLVCIFAFVIAIAQNHFNLVSHAYPLDYNEPSMLVTTSTIASGGNPYSLESQPERNSVYPVLFSILVAPLSLAFGNTLELHRILVGLFLIASCGLCYSLCRQESVPRTESFVVAALWYAALLYYSTPVAGPNGLGLFLFMLAITVPRACGFSTRSLAFTIVLGVLAFFTKQYFIACLGYVALYLFLAESKKRAVYFALAAVSVFVVALLLVCYTSPYYIENSFFAVLSTARLAASDEKLMDQLQEFGLIYLPLLVFLTVALAVNVASALHEREQQPRGTSHTSLVSLFDLDQPLFTRKPNYIWVCCVCSVVIVVLALGKNRGNHMTYLFQLISPFFLIGVFALAAKMPKWHWPFRFLVVVGLYNSYAMLPGDFSVREEPWDRIRHEIATADDIYASPLLISEVMHKGAPIYLSGATPYFFFGNPTPSFLAKTDPKQSVLAVWNNYAERIHTKIRNREFDLLLLDHSMILPTSTGESAAEARAFLGEYYQLLDTIRLQLLDRPGGGYYSVEIWRPKNAG